MSMTVLSPSPRLAPYVRAFMVVEVREETTRVRLPELGLVLGVRYQGSASVIAGDAASRIADNSLAGMATKARRMRTAAGSGVVLAHFHPAGAAQFFAEPLHELLDESIALDELVPRGELDRVASRVAEAGDHAQRVAALEELLVARMRPAPPDPVVEAAVRAIRESRGAIRIRALARSLAISQDPLEKRFRRAVGATPKQFASLVRLRHAVDAYRAGTRLSTLALDAGYFDQSHFNREFRAVFGQPPGRFFRGAPTGGRRVSTREAQQPASRGPTDDEPPGEMVTRRSNARGRRDALDPLAGDPPESRLPENRRALDPD